MMKLPTVYNIHNCEAEIGMYVPVIYLMKNSYLYKRRRVLEYLILGMIR